jgi:hypothetical protein
LHSWFPRANFSMAVFVIRTLRSGKKPNRASGLPQ